MSDILQSIVLIRSGGEQGSGFLLRGGYVLTANHNIRDECPEFYGYNPGTKKFNQPLEVHFDDFVIRKSKQDGDFAAFKLKFGEDFKHRCLPLLPEIGSDQCPFMCYGFPTDEGEWTGRAYNDGKIDAIQMPAESASYQRMNLLFEGGIIKGGFSGSPIYDPGRKAVVGIILQSDDKVDAIGVGGAWIKKHLPDLPKPTGVVNRFFDKDIPNLDYHHFTCNREVQIEQLSTYFQKRIAQREHQHIFLFGKKWDKPDSLVCRFLQEQRSKKRPLQFDIPFEKIQDAYDYLKPQEMPLSEDELKDVFELRLQAINQHPKSDYVVFFWRIPSNIWKKTTALSLLAALLNGSLLNNWAKEHRLLIFYWLEPESQPVGNWWTQWLAAKSTCRGSQAVQKILNTAPAIYCLIDSWDSITETHLENWFDRCCVNIARASEVYRNWLKAEQPLKMATVEAKIQDLIIQHNPDYQHLRS